MESVRARLWVRVGEKTVKCMVCHRGCIIPEGRVGVCGNYMNVNGELHHIGYGKISAIESRPIEIKPFFHYWPNSTALTFSGWGCNFYCPWCQNHHISFKLPSPEQRIFPPDKLVENAVQYGDNGLCASFNEPATLYDYLLDVFTEASRRGLYGCVVTNGYFTPRAVDELVESGCDGWCIDIKGSPYMKRPLSYINHELVFETAKRVLDNNGHVEMVYLVVTNTNDSEETVNWILKQHADKLGCNVPLHINRYYPQHAWREPPTPIEKLLEIAELARREYGLKYVYIGNVSKPELESTKCPRCGRTVIYRVGYRVLKYDLARDNRCPNCGEKIPIRGRFTINYQF